MPNENMVPVVLLVYTNERVEPDHHLRNLAEELRRIRAALKPVEDAGLCKVLSEPNATATQLFDVFQQYRGRIAIFHYAGHADESLLLFESASGGRAPIDHRGLALFLGEQHGLTFVFLNGCSTDAQVRALFDANCPVVVATSRSIDDTVAMQFAERFYNGLGTGASLQSAFNEACGDVMATAGEPRHVHWAGAAERGLQDARWPWDLAIRPGAEESGHWSLSAAAGDPLFGLPDLPKMDLPETPFRHLHWFQREHSNVFFGRESDIRRAYDRLMSNDLAPILLLYGAAGVGKSSLLEAGLLPRLESSHRVHYLRRDPELGLLGSLMQPIRQGSESAAQAWLRDEAAAGKPLLLALDQAEEVFSRATAHSSDELGEFLDGLEAIFGRREQRPRGRLILGFREEWLADFEDSLRRRSLPWENLRLRSLDREGITAAVEGPMRRPSLREHYRLQIEEGLAAEIADVLSADPDSPVAPTLQILLSKFWVEAKAVNDDQPRFTRALYMELKRQGLLLKDFLDGQLDALLRRQPAAAESGLALDLLAFHTTPAGAAAQCVEEQLLKHYEHVVDTVREIVAHFRHGYLLADIPSDRKTPVKGTRLAHDTLAPLVRERFEKSDRPGQRARRVLENRAGEWKDGKTGALLDEPDLVIAEAGAQGMRAWSDDERRLVEASRAEALRRREAEARRLQELEEARRRVERQTRVAIARLQAYEARAVADRFPLRALLLAAEAVKRPLEADGVALGGPESVLRELVGRTGGLPLRGHEDGIDAIAFDPRGRWLATGSGDHTARLWDLADPNAEPRVLRGHEGRLGAIAFDPQGRWLATGSGDGTARLWDLADPNAEPQVLRGHEDRIGAVAFDRKGRWLATGSNDDTARLWDLVDPNAEPQVLRGQEDWFGAVAFDMQGRWLATGSTDGTARLWDLADPNAEPRVLRGHDEWIGAIAFDRQGRWLATGSGDGTARLWDLAADPNAEPQVLRGHEDRIGAVAFDPRGRWLATGGNDGTARLWDLADPNAEPRVLRGHEDSINAIAFDRQGRWLATGSNDGTARLWDLADPNAEPRVLRGYEGRLGAIAFDPQGRWLATGDGDGTARLWDLADPNAEPRVLRGHEDWIGAVAFDPQGRWLATGSNDGTARLWDLADPNAEPRVLRGHEDWIGAIAFDPRGRWLATGSGDVSVRLWALDAQSLLRWARRLVGRNLTRQEWLQHMGSLDYQATFQDLPIPA